MEFYTQSITNTDHNTPQSINIIVTHFKQGMNNASTYVPGQLNPIDGSLNVVMST